MLRHLLLGLLVLCLSLPAVAMTGHCTVPERAPAASCHETAGHEVPAKTPVQAKDCIGCVTPLATPDAPTIVLGLRGMRAMPLLEQAPALLPAQPETPPPRA